MSFEMPPPNTPEEGVAAPTISSRADARRIFGSGVPSTIYDSPASSPGGSRRSSVADYGPYQVPSRGHTHDQSESGIDYQALDYAQQIDEALLCPICHTPFFMPMTTKTCGHTFCASCLDRALEAQHVCPIDRRPLDISRDISQTRTRVILDQLDRLKVKCPNSGCDHVCSRELLYAHVERYCGQTLVRCPDHHCDEMICRKDARPENGCLHYVTPCPYCEMAITFNDLERHCDQECTGQEAECPHCDAVLVRHRLAKHIATDCREVETHCQFQSAGCKQVARRKDIEEHLKNGCIYEAIANLMQAREEDHKIINELKGRLDALDGRTRHLERYGGGGGGSSGVRESSAFTRAAPPSSGLTADALNNLNRMQSATSGYADIDEANHNITLDDLFETFDQENNRHNDSNYSSPQAAAAAMAVDAPPAPWAHNSGDGPWESPEDYMLSQFEAMEAKIEDLRKMMVELDGRHTMRLVNDTMRMNEQIAELGSKVGVLGMHTTWLMSMQRQSRGQQNGSGSTPGTTRSNISAGGGGSGGGSGGTGGNNEEERGRTNTAAAGPSSSSRTATQTQQGSRNGDGESARGRFLNTSDIPPLRRSSVGRGENPPRL
ncbi:hypothetical protein NEUTE1DRAFT_84491 [Neurospora tetrasperma FGSC 2508]|uniref:RING-type domain-containing protein n=1 Tax=Neurospora tetrasperma (strain FGSC 2508 / ATCC MYA-4615 / P0657) TaxID=510951 RepID=F8MRL9_NEUT8|nr:uncharacterized protein NEUTE1DRAFT_84491 [Neurospora tetrasperma FGSC 2508]EGO56920.1 hypothetical protein NEUTE1DRAFT_84491 [Neurospora tetrasperma FGSC 2508]EGZ70177.1 hypothetical protein NEUTE2DRAFT_158681 [Neurospora tetrasperma FGSC 2509]